MTKRSISFILVLVLALSICLPALGLANNFMYVVTANGKSLNFRTSPHTHSNNKIGNIPFGAQVWVETRINGGEWSYITYNNEKGYVMSRYLQANKPTHKPTPRPTKKPGTTPTPSSSALNFDKFVTANYTAVVRPSTPSGFVHMRWAPSKQYRVIRDYYAGSQLEIIAQNDTWAQVRDVQTGVVGFMMRAFLVADGGSVVVGSDS